MAEYIDPKKQADMARELGCTFCDNGYYAEMSMPLENYAEKTQPIDGVTYGFYHGDLKTLHEAVLRVDDTWVQYYDETIPTFCAMVDGKIASFCQVELEADCIISRPGEHVVSIGCVGTVPEMRRRGIGLRMVDLATVWAKEQGSTRGYIHYTGVAHWYAKLGYVTFARFDLPGRP